MRLTYPQAWHTFAGGTSAASDRNSYKAITSIGDYSISPVSSPHNVEQHLGYMVTFQNIKGVLLGGLYHWLASKPTRLVEARLLCQEHMKANKGEAVPPS